MSKFHNAFFTQKRTFTMFIAQFTFLNQTKQNFRHRRISSIRVCVCVLIYSLILRIIPLNILTSTCFTQTKYPKDLKGEVFSRKIIDKDKQKKKEKKIISQNVKISSSNNSSSEHTGSYYYCYNNRYWRSCPPPSRGFD